MDKEKGLFYSIGVSRILLGWIMIWAFFDKLLGLGFETPAGCGLINGYSPSSFVKYASGGMLADFWNSIGGNAAVDLLLMAGLLLIGIALILGIASKITTVALIVFMICMYSIYVPPKDNPLIDFRIVFAVLACIIYFSDGFSKLGLEDRWRQLSIVKRFPVLE